MWKVFPTGCLSVFLTWNMKRICSDLVRCHGDQRLSLSNRQPLRSNSRSLLSPHWCWLLPPHTEALSAGWRWGQQGALVSHLCLTGWCGSQCQRWTLSGRNLKTKHQSWTGERQVQHGNKQKTNTQRKVLCDTNKASSEHFIFYF